jgi:hypothetical protein
MAKKEKNNALTFTETRGRVGLEEVTAFEYPGADHGLSNYTFRGKSYFGTVQFTEVYETKVRKLKQTI